jgi:hypothetical protein
MNELGDYYVKLNNTGTDITNIIWHVESKKQDLE